MQPRLSWTSPVSRGGFVVLLLFALSAIVHAQPSVPGAVRFQPDKKTSDKTDTKKEETKDEKKEPEIKWPTEVGGKTIAAVVKDLDDKDPTVREYAARCLPQFGPTAVQKPAVSAILVKQLKAERDPGVKMALIDTVGLIPFDKEADNIDTLNYLATLAEEARDSQVRLHAVQAIALFGEKGAPAITRLTGPASKDPSYEIRRNVAASLGRIAFHSKTGPNTLAYGRLANDLASDDSAAVRLEALQSLMFLGPPWAAPRKPNDANPPPINVKKAAEVIIAMRKRVGDPNAKPHPLPALEKDPQVEIWARLVLMRFDPREVNDENIDAIARFLSGAEPATKIQALNAIIVVGEMASKKLNAVIAVLEEKDPSYQLTIASIRALMAMGAGAKPAIKNLDTMRKAKEEELKATVLKLAEKKDDPQLTAEKFTLEELTKLLKKAIEHIEKAKPMSAAAENPDPPKK